MFGVVADGSGTGHLGPRENGRIVSGRSHDRKSVMNAIPSVVFGVDEE